MYTETAFRNRTRQYYYCSRYRVYLRRDLSGKHVIVVKIILCYAAVDSRRFFCRRPDNNDGAGGRGDRCEIGNREGKNIVFNIMICIIVIVHCRRSRVCLYKHIITRHSSLRRRRTTRTTRSAGILYIIIIIIYIYARFYTVSI